MSTSPTQFQIGTTPAGQVTTSPVSGPPTSPNTGSVEICPLGHSQTPLFLGKIVANQVYAPVGLRQPVIIADDRICSVCGIRYAINFANG